MRRTLDVAPDRAPDFENILKLETEYWVSMTLSTLTGHDGARHGFAFVARDIAETCCTHRAPLTAHREIAHQAHRDPPTGLVNRHAFDRELAARRARSAATDARQDRFGPVQASERRARPCRGQFRAANGGRHFARRDPPRSRAMNSPFRSTARAARLLERIGEGMIHDGALCRVSASFGIARAEDGLLEDVDLLRRSNAALHFAKRARHGRARLCTPRPHRVAVEEWCIPAENEGAIGRDEFTPFHQPQFCAQSGAPTGLEPLLRRRHLSRGLPVAGKLSPVKATDAVVPRAGLAEIGARQAQRPGIPKLLLNMSAARLDGPDLAQVIQSGPARGPRIACETLESAPLNDKGPRLSLRVDRPRELGIEIGDFGLNHASAIGLRRPRW
jgi:GGDEF domain-containing protein